LSFVAVSVGGWGRLCVRLRPVGLFGLSCRFCGGCGLGTASAELGNLLNWALFVRFRKDGIYKFSAAEWNFSSN
jgi:hypothetical protein